MPDSSRPSTLGGADRAVGAWVAQELGYAGPEEFGPYSACGVLLDGALIAGIIYSDYRKLSHGASMQASIASTSPRWATHRVLHCLFAYPFVQMNVVRFWVSVARRNKRARRCAERLGFRMEGIARRGHDGRQDAAVYSMLPHECRWIDRGSR